MSRRAPFAQTPTQSREPTAMNPTSGPTPRPSPTAVLAAALAVAVTACGGGAPNAQAPDGRTATPVRVVEARVATHAGAVRSAGTLASKAEMELAFKVGGYLGELRADEGQTVRAGQVLARLRTDEVDAGVRAAEASAELAARNLARMERLFADSVVPEARLDEARDAHERARAGLEVARFDREHATIRAPSDGRVLRRMREVAELVPAGVPVFRFGATAGGWIVRLDVADHQVVRLGPGDSARITLSALDGVALTGRVSEIADAADPRSGTFEVEVAVEPPADLPPGAFRSGMVADVEIALAEGAALAWLPTQSLVEVDGRAAAVFVLEGDAARRRDVRVVRLDADGVGVAGDGLDGARVVTDGAAYLREGERVEVVR